MGEEDIEEMEYKKELENMRPEDVLEFLYELSDEWKKTKDPVEKIKEDLRAMISTFKEDKFERMNVHFRIL